MREQMLAGKYSLVSIWKGLGGYPSGSLHHPSERYPEYPFGEVTGTGNTVYSGVREALRQLGLDEENYGTKDWNPLGDLVRPGDNVLIKPNLIRESHAKRTDEWEQVITHPSVIRAILDYVYIALRGDGRVTIADGPQTDSDFGKICHRMSLESVIDFFHERGLEISVVDLRREHWLQKGGVTCERRALPGDPRGYVDVDLGQASEFHDYGLNGRFYGADYDVSETARYHNDGRHAYVLCRTAMEADVIINLPKMKTHKKTGVTLSLKNMVGVNGLRNCLPHHTIGTAADGGDEFPDGGRNNRLQSLAIAGFKRHLTSVGGSGGAVSRLAVRLGRLVFGDTARVVRSGNWHGNDTLWRTVLDLNKILFHFGGSGERRSSPPRYLAVVDGVIAGDGDGPSSPDKKSAGLIVAGLNPVALDTVCATLMGFDFEKIPLLVNAWRIEQDPLVDFGPEELTCRSNVPQWCGNLQNLRNAEHLGFHPHFGWAGHIEMDERNSVESCSQPARPG
ncbi:MAG: DUF362 domain-containing protein [Planctomycetota bacterium]